jgi:hypothetical protein
MPASFTRGLLVAALFDVVAIAVVYMVGSNVGWW